MPPDVPHCVGCCSAVAHHLASQHAMEPTGEADQLIAEPTLADLLDEADRHPVGAVVRAWNLVEHVAKPFGNTDADFYLMTRMLGKAGLLPDDLVGVAERLRRMRSQVVHGNGIPTREAARDPRLGPPLCTAHPVSRSVFPRSPPRANVHAASIASRGRESARCALSKISSTSCALSAAHLVTKVLHAQNDLAVSFATVTILVHQHWTPPLSYSALGSSTPDQPTVVNVSAEHI